MRSRSAVPDSVSPPHPGNARTPRWLPRAGLVAILVVAGVLRYTGLSAGLRHTPQVDERFFVENVRGMIARGDLNHRFHEYPGFLFVILLPFVWAADAWAGPGPAAYLAARAVLATFGVASVWMVWRLGRALAGPATGLSAALFLAVSPVEVHAASTLRPDVALHTLVLLGLLAFTRGKAAAADDLLSGAAIGAATAVKFTGVLLAPCYLVQRLAARRFRPSLVLLAALASVAVYALLSPYTFLDLGGFLEGARSQVGYHYGRAELATHDRLEMAGLYAWVVVKAMGVPGAMLAVLGLVMRRRDWRRWLPLLVLPVLTLAVFSTSPVLHDRFMLPALGVVALFAGGAVEALARRTVSLKVAVAVAVAAIPLSQSVEYVRLIATPSARDRAVDWVIANLPPGSRVLTTLPDLGLDRSRWEVVVTPALGGRTRHLLPWVDVVVAEKGAAAEVPGLALRAEFMPTDPRLGPSLVVASLTDPKREDEFRPVPLRPSQLAASDGGGLLAALVDGDLETTWQVPGAQEPGSWLEVRLDEPELVGRIDLLQGRRRRRFPRALQLFVQDERGQWVRVPTLGGRPPVDQQLGPREGASVVLVLSPVRTSALRLVQAGRRGRPWSVAELRVFARRGPA